MTNQNKPFRTVAVLGAGVMGSQIAAHLANAGMTVHLLDIAAKTGNKNDVVKTAFNKALKLSPPILFTEKTARRLTLGNFDRYRSTNLRTNAVVWALAFRERGSSGKRYSQLYRQPHRNVRDDARNKSFNRKRIYD